jgi:quinol monooxygenase YgiN
VEYLRTLAAASRRERGNVRLDVLVSERKNHMTVVEVWRSAAALESHLSEPHTQAFRTSMAPLHGALYDERVYRAL